jgi:phosphoribosyl 1,2-cyclic phosphodiesterase
LIEAFVGVHMLAIESNYDPQMQLSSARPEFLKSRIMGGRGHLSNAECFAAVARIFDLSQQRFGQLPSQLVLLHRSQECNCPDLLRRYFHRDARFADRLTLAHQDCSTEWISPVERATSLGEQMLFGWSRAIA